MTTRREVIALYRTAGAPAARTAAEALVGHRERPLRLLVGAVAEISAAHRLLERLRPFSQGLRKVVAAEAEDEGVDHDERDERAEHRAARHRRDRVGGAQEAVDDEGLASDLSSEPAEQDGAEARRRHQHGGVQKPAVLEQPAAPAQPQAPEPQ